MSAAADFREFLEGNAALLANVQAMLRKDNDWPAAARSPEIKRLREQYVRFSCDYQWWIAANSDLDIVDNTTVKLIAATNIAMRKINVRTHEIRSMLTGVDAVIF